MPGKTVGLSLNYGFEGNPAFSPDNITQAKVVASDSDAIPFGKAVILNDDNTVDAVTSTVLTLANFTGIAAAVVKQRTDYLSTTDGHVGSYLANEMCDIIKRGVVPVYVAHGTPTTTGGVFVRKTLNGSFPAEVVGDFRADADGGNTVDLSTLLCWETGAVDGKGIGLVRIKTINN